MNNVKYCFVTITDYSFFPGTVATVNSILYFHPNATIYVVQNDKSPLSGPQAMLLRQSPQVTLVHSKTMERDDRYINAWELKAYAANDLCVGFDVIVGIDSDCLLCSPVEEQIVHAYKSGGWLGGKDGDGTNYGNDYNIYGMQTPTKNLKYMSTSLYFCAVTEENRQILARWAECCSKAVFNGQGPFPGHGDQGVLNAVLFTRNKSQKVELLPNELWSQHWVYWNTISDFQNGSFINRSVGMKNQRSFHCGGAEKFWNKQHRDRVVLDHPLQTYPYVWYLAMFWFGTCREWIRDPAQYLPQACYHLVEDLFAFLPQIMAVHPTSRQLWEEVTDALLNRAIHGIPRF